MQIFRWPSLRNPVDILFLSACFVLTAYVLVPEIWGSGKGKDYVLWFWAGQQVLKGGALYNPVNGIVEFIYPPTSALLLAIPSFFGKIPLYFALCVLNAAAWWMAGQLSGAMVGSEEVRGQWLAALPGIATVPYVFENFALGQPNLVLLAMMLAGFWLLQRGSPWSAGAIFALATAMKVFPIAVLPYLVFRRRWRATIAMVMALGVILIVAPAPVRGYERNVTELKTWFNDMVGSASEKGFGQRGTQNWSWINQSLIAQTHRFTRHIDYNQVDPEGPVGYVNAIDVSYGTANWIVLGVAALIGIGFMSIVPAQSNMTPRSTADELGILFCLMTIASPLARHYYFIWLFFPLTVLVNRASLDPRPAVRRATWGVLAIAGVLMLLSLPVFPIVFQALGNNLVATMMIAAGLAWHMRHPPLAFTEQKVPGADPKTRASSSSKSNFEGPAPVG